jgi:ribonuclease Y
MSPVLWIVIIAVVVAVAVLCFLLGINYRKKVAEREIASAEEEAKRIINESIKSAESKKREALVEAKEEIHKNRSEYEREVKERRADLQKQERRLQQKEENLDRKLDAAEKKTDSLNGKIAAVEAQQQEVALVKKSQLEMLEKISGFTVEEAKTYLINNIRDDVTHEMAVKVKEI